MKSNSYFFKSYPSFTRQLSVYQCLSLELTTLRELKKNLDSQTLSEEELTVADCYLIILSREYQSLNYYYFRRFEDSKNYESFQNNSHLIANIKDIILEKITQSDNQPAMKEDFCTTYYGMPLPNISNKPKLTNNFISFKL